LTEQDRSDRIEIQEVTAQKRRLRKKIRKLLAKQKEKERTEKSKKIKERLFSLSVFRKAKTIMFYVATDEEVDTRPIIREALRLGKEVVVPEIKPVSGELIASKIINVDKDLIKGLYGVYHPKKKFLRPVAPAEIDLVVVPGLAFDLEGNRLGRGAGYYDRFLKRLPALTASIGLAFDFQIVENLPYLSPDVPVKEVLSA
jgi:5-formyltetrahydrofolate cyclo-ligase